ncbi:MAG TPA: cyclic nucleotide-binding domain-containing protein [Anaerolineaceae bacterium]|nr:cyclic nucleotide-binding domain-containing protein [Anaerolineaceae bacterium]
MPLPDYAQAHEYALGRLEHELAPKLVYHWMAHTTNDVLPAAERLAERSGVSESDLLLLRTAVMFHDLGFVEKRIDHEEVGMRLASEVLPKFGYSAWQIVIIQGMIRATRLPQSPESPLEELIADADLDVFGRPDFFARNQALREEMATFGELFSDEEWYTQQVTFMKSHHYFTQAARDLRDEGKQENLQAMCARLEQLCSGGNSAPDVLQVSRTERVAVLRAVSIFADTPDDTLAQLADLLQPLLYRAGETVFNKGDTGDSMYIIRRGRVRVHEGEMTLNYLGVADVFGEMALLDIEPRLASVTCVEETHVLRLAQDDFYEMMANHPEVARGVIRVLNRRLRARVRDMVQDFEYMQQMAQLSSAAIALETGNYDRRSLESVTQRADELGQLARTFQRMADEVVSREQRLREQVQELQIQIDEVKKAHQVTEITESDYFQELQKRVKEMRRRKDV